MISPSKFLELLENYFSCLEKIALSSFSELLTNGLSELFFCGDSSSKSTLLTLIGGILGETISFNLYSSCARYSYSAVSS